MNLLANQAQTTELLTQSTFTSLGGFATATYLVSSAIQRAFNVNPAWLALAVAQVLCLGKVAIDGGGPGDYFLGFVNGCLVFLTATGANAVGASVASARSDTQEEAAPVEVTRPGETPRGAPATRGGASAEPAPQASRRGFLSSWL